MEGPDKYQNTFKTPKELEDMAQLKYDEELKDIEAKKLRDLEEKEAEKQRQRSIGEQLNIDLK